jgi:hypothetical protein
MPNVLARVNRCLGTLENLVLRQELQIPQVLPNGEMIRMP